MHEILNIPPEAYQGDIRTLLEGHRFELAGLHGVVEADFFDWPVSIEAGAPIVRGIARRLSRFAWADVDHDVLKVLYESVIDKTTRKRLGEYYTPDWLAQKMVDEHVTDPMRQRVLDPACGSGTFLFWTIRKIIETCDAAGTSDRETLEHVVSHVFGMDLHPVAVTLARVLLTRARCRWNTRAPVLADRIGLCEGAYAGDISHLGSWERGSSPTQKVDGDLLSPT